MSYIKPIRHYESMLDFYVARLILKWLSYWHTSFVRLKLKIQFSNTMCITFSSRQESQSRGSDETLSSPRSPEGMYDNISLTSYVALPLGNFFADK